MIFIVDDAINETNLEINMRNSTTSFLVVLVGVTLIGVNYSTVDAKGFDQYGNAIDDKCKY